MKCEQTVVLDKFLSGEERNNPLPASSEFCSLLMIYADILDHDQARQNIFKNVMLKNISRQ